MHIDARGLECPHPVIQAKKALHGALDPITIAVDNAIAVENLEKMAGELGHGSAARQIADDHYEVTITPSGPSTAASAPAKAEQAPALRPPLSPEMPARHEQNGMVVHIGARTMGEGDDQLGGALMKAFLYALTELDTAPDHLIFLNGGVFLTTEGSNSLEDLKALEARGTRIHSCGTCLEYHALRDKLRVGGVSNMYEIAGLLANAAKVIRP